MTKKHPALVMVCGLMEPLLKRPFFYYIRKFKQPFSLGIGSLLITDITDVLTPLVLGWLLDQIIVSFDLKALMPLFFIFMGLSLVNAFARYFWRIFFAKFNQNVAHDLRQKLFKAYFHHDFLNFQSVSTGHKMSVFTKDVENFRLGIGPGLLILADALLYLIFIPAVLFWLNPKWAMILIVIAPMVPFVMAFVEKKLNALFDNQQELLNELSSQSQESLEGAKVIKSFQMEFLRKKFYEKYNFLLYRNSAKLEFIHASFSPLFEIFIFASCALLLFKVGNTPDFSNLKIGMVFSFFQYFQRMTWPLSALGFSYMMISEAKSSFRKIEEAFKNQTVSPLPPPLNAKNFFEAENVNFEYPEEAFFKNLNLKLNYGKSYLIAGKTKSGKTSLLNLISGAFSNFSGTLRLNHSALRTNPQEPFLFMDSLKNNLKLSKVDSLKKSDFDKVAFEKELQELSQGLNTPIGEKGANLSGGQKQRLSLLRILKETAPVLILDEPISAVDEDTKKILIQTLKEASKTKTLIVSTSNPEHFLWMDRLLFVEENQTRTTTNVSLQEAKKMPAFLELLAKKPPSSKKKKEAYS